jgi:hypothetical protein
MASIDASGERSRGAFGARRRHEASEFTSEGDGGAMARMGSVELLLDYLLLSNDDLFLPDALLTLRAFVHALRRRGISAEVTFKGGGPAQVWSDEISDAIWFCLRSGCLEESLEGGRDRYTLPRRSEAIGEVKALVRRTSDFERELDGAYKEAVATVG